MAMKQAQRQVYRSMQGKEIDLDKLRMRNEMTIAVGNARVNARGDELGPGGKIIKKREEIVAEYYEANPKATPRKGAGVGVETTVVETPVVTKSKKTQSEE